MAPDYDRLMLMQKVEVFEHALESTNGDDLARILWTKSPSSEVRNIKLYIKYRLNMYTLPSHHFILY